MHSAYLLKCRLKDKFVLCVTHTGIFVSLLIQVRAVCGATYMLNQDEELWEKDLPPAVEQLLSEAKDPLADRGDRCK